MASSDQARITAQNLMSRALELLDAIGDHASACHLQHALDVSRNVAIPGTIEEVEAELAGVEAQTLLARLDGARVQTVAAMNELTTNELKQRIEDELQLASRSDSITVKSKHLNLASKYATTHERRTREVG